MEGTRAQLRILETKFNKKLAEETLLDYDKKYASPSTASLSLKLACKDPVVDLSDKTKHKNSSVMDEIYQNSSSTESAQDQDKSSNRNSNTPRRMKPSRIPLLGSRTFFNKGGSSKGSVSDLADSPGMCMSSQQSNKSEENLYSENIYKSTESLSFSNSKREELSHYPDSVENWRNLSIDAKIRSSSIPVSNKSVELSTVKPTTTTTTVTLTTKPNITPNSAASKYSSSLQSKHMRGKNMPNIRSNINSSNDNLINNSNNHHKNDKTSENNQNSEKFELDEETSDYNKVKNIKSSIWNWLKI